MARTTSTPRWPPLGPVPAILLSAALVLVGALAGCTARQGAADARLDYDGSTDATHSDTAVCSDRGRMNIAGSLVAGHVVLTIRDGDNQTIYNQTLQEDLRSDDQALTGAPGPWEVQAIRADGFQGHYQVRVWCNE